MTAIWNGFLLLLARATDRELAKMVEFLKAENQILRAKLPRRIEVTPAERHRLIKIGRPLCHRIRELLSIVSMRTFYRWLKAEENGTPNQMHSSKGGRPKTPANVRTLVLRMANENGWGFGRIVANSTSWASASPRRPSKGFCVKTALTLAPNVDAGPGRSLSSVMPRRSGPATSLRRRSGRWADGSTTLPCFSSMSARVASSWPA
jgi:putative transposase